MLSEKDEAFFQYWKDNRERERKLFRQFAAGLPVGVSLAVGILVAVLSGWDKRAESDINTSLNPVVLIIALAIIIVFIAIFHKKHQWDLNEEHYLELLNKKRKQEKLSEPNI